MGHLAEVSCCADGSHIEQHDQQILAHQRGASSGNQESEPWLVQAWLPCHSVAALAVLVFKDLTPEADTLVDC